MRACLLLLLLSVSCGSAFAAGVPDKGRPGQLDVLVFGDPQVKNVQDVGYYEREIVAPLVGKQHAQLGLSLGDIAEDPAMYPRVKAVDAQLHLPWMYAPGNHDVDADATGDDDSLKAWHAAFGKDSTGRNEKLASFVMLDDVIAQPDKSPAYVGGLREDQFAFLGKFLRTVPKDNLLVIGLHIPLFEVGNTETFRVADRERLFALLEDFPHVLILSAHTHAQQNYWHDANDGWHGAQPLHEYNVGTACGAFWAGAKDADGIPDSTMGDGTPNGYATLAVKPHGDYSLAWHPGRDPNAAMRLHAPKVLRKGEYPGYGVFANVFMGDAQTRVEFRVDGGAWKPMKRVVQADPYLLAENVRDDEADALRGYDRSDEAQVSTHLWRGALPTDLALGEHQVEVRELDRWQGEQRAQTSYRLQDASP